MLKTAMKALMALALATGLTACDRALTKEQRTEREEARYQEAMRNYKSGNLKAAVNELTDVVRGNPGNLSARFLLATLQQERKDYLGAFCNFREFVQLSSDKEKVEMSKRRMALCEEQIAKELAKKLNVTGAAVQESESARKDLASSQKTVARLTQDLAAAEQKLSALSAENARLRKMIAAVGEEEPEPQKMVVREDVKSLLDDEEEEETEATGTSLPRGIAAAKALVADADDEAKPLVSSAADETDGRARRPATAAGGKDLTWSLRPPKEGPKDAPHEEKPATYVVQEGDTLYRIAMRFYGNRTYWKQIREANKATISNDGRVNAGQTIVLP